MISGRSGFESISVEDIEVTAVGVKFAVVLSGNFVNDSAFF